MDSIPLFERVLDAMADPGFYPHPVENLRRVETHISVVFLTGAFAYKLKKPMNLGFLDFREPADRRLFCEREVALNRRLSHGVYHGVVAIAADPVKGFAFSAHGEPVEYAVKMTQLPDAARLENLLRQNRVREKDMAALGRLLADFYEKSERSAGIDAFGSRDTVIFNTEENFQQIAPFVDRLVEPERWRFICEVNRSFLHRHHALFEKRIAEGRIRDGHGDLRTDHIYFVDGAIQVIDCIEFNERFRYGDAALDLAFIHMDLEKQGFQEMSQALLTGYVSAAKDPELYGILDFYAAYRAIVRLKVACLRHDEKRLSPADRAALRADITAHLLQAFRYTLLFSRPTLWVFCGLPASGKSALAERVAGALSMAVIGSDALRKKEDPESGVTAYGKGKYTPERRRRIYTRMFALAHERLKAGRSVALDATFGSRDLRDEAVKLSLTADAGLIFVECRCPEALLVSRLKAREQTVGGSDARLFHLPDMIRHFEPLSDMPRHQHLAAETDRPIAKTVCRVLSKAYLLKSIQIAHRI